MRARGQLGSLQWRLLAAFVLLAVVPLGAAGLWVNHRLTEVRRSVNDAATTYERRATNIADDVAAFLRACEDDLRELARAPRTAEAYLRFAREHHREVWVRGGTNEHITEERFAIPLYKEVSFIDPAGREQILIRGEELVAASGLRDVSDPANTTYRSERYFLEARDNAAGEIHVSRLTGFHLTRFEQLGLDEIIARLADVDERTRAVYRKLAYEWLETAGVVRRASAFEEGERRVIVYRQPGVAQRILVDDPGDIDEAERQTRELELRELIDGLKPEDVVEGGRYDGVIRFAVPVAGAGGAVEGVVSLALDHAHLMQFTQHVQGMQRQAVAFAGYGGADYTYMFDDEGWIITHPKQWDIRGVDRTGKAVPAYTERTSPVEVLVGRIPINLLQLDWKAGEGYHRTVLETRAGNTGIISHFNLGGVPRTRIYSPIRYDTGAYAEHGIFGGVMLGTDSQRFIGLMQRINDDIASRVAKLRRSLFWLLGLVLIVVAALSVLTARRLVRPVQLLGEAARRIGEGDLDAPVPTDRRDEIGDLARSFGEMAANLKRTFAELEGTNRDLREAQDQLLATEREKQRRLEREVAVLQREISGATFAGMISESPQMKGIQEEIVRIAPSSASVLIRGDNGTGKELVAEAIHRNSPRRDRKFLRVNCAAFNENLLESELFGHVRGAYTGAVADRKGLFESADEGTLLLDEVGDMSLEMQKKLLRTLQEGEITPVGASRVRRVDVRVLAATNQDLEAMLDAGSFRRDLYHRLDVITIEIPPLRERRADILPLAALFLERFADAEGKAVVGLAEEAERLLVEHPWPGNVRELEHAVERAVIRTRGDVLTADDFQLASRERELPTLHQARGQDWTLAEVERAYIMSVLQEQGGNKKATAEILGIGYNTLWRKLKKYSGD